MRLYAAVRVARGVLLGAATHHPSMAVVSELASFAPLWADGSKTLGGVLAILYAGEYAGEMLRTIEKPLRGVLAMEATGILLALLLWAFFEAIRPA